MSEENTLSVDVGEDGVGQRADKYLGHATEFSRSRVQGLISGGHVALNGVVLGSASKKLELNDVLSVRVPEPESAFPQAEDITLKVVYEDEDLLVIDKPAGLVVHPGAGNATGTLVNALLYHCKDSLSGIGGVVRPGIVHRLDKDTSGLLIVAKNDFAHQHLAAQLSERSLSRHYKALVTGVPVPMKGVVDRAIGRHRHNRLKMSVMSNSSRHARTHYTVIEAFGQACALVECKLETGRTHQIRVHMEAIGHPLIGDPLYGAQPTLVRSRLKKEGYLPDFIEEIVSFPRQFLHAYKLSFVHPRSEEVMKFESLLPDDLENLYQKLHDKK